MRPFQTLRRGVKRPFLSWVDAGERVVARILALITGVVIASALLKLVLYLGSKLLTGSEATWLGDHLIKVLGDLLTVLIALEVLENITSYLRRHVVQIELVLVTALTAVARKVIVLPSGAENKPQLLIGLGIAVVSISAAYWLVKSANIMPAKVFPDQDQSSPPRKANAGESGEGLRN
ncbi:phosphate-starvation-inducible PsiE family protein [Synechococcus sp. M16CYN]|uniref:phosphate-starvation-inducible PsiE family protein n=1 Tax=Synechococcus sp. M16CYN TaxID=3103139 RepID=UPI0030E051F4